MQNEREQTEEDLRKWFLRGGAHFFEYNSGKNTPNILLQLSERIERLDGTAKDTTVAILKLDASVRDASASSTKLAATLNKLTLWLAIVGGAGGLISIASLLFQILKK
jgi:hypothetical protein